MSAIGDRQAQLRAALAGIEGVAVVPPGGVVDPPAVLVLPPAVTWDGFSRPATFDVVLVVPLDEDAGDRLYDLLDPVAQACEQVRDAVCIRADPGTFPVGDNDRLPSYTFQIEVPL